MMRGRQWAAQSVKLSSFSSEKTTLEGRQRSQGDAYQTTD